MIPSLGERVALLYKAEYNQLMSCIIQAIHTCPFVETDDGPTIKFSIQVPIPPDLWQHIKDLFVAKDWFLKKVTTTHDIHEIYLTNARVI